MSAQIYPSFQNQLADLETQVEQGFVSAANALREIKESKIYKEQYGTWENYLKDRWGYNRDWYYKLVQASDVIKNVSNLNIFLPTTESQARELAPLDPPQQVQVWQEVSTNLKSGQVFSVSSVLESSATG